MLPTTPLRRGSRRVEAVRNKLGRRMRLLGIAGWSGSGKTTLVVKLLPELVGRGLSVSTIKHAHHSFDVDKPGKDSYEHRAAGAAEVMVSSAHRWALMHENRNVPEPALDSLVAHMAPVDLLLIEGFKAGSHDKIEIHRPSLAKPLLCSQDPHVVAVASDGQLGRVGVPVLSLGDVVAIADFVVDHCGLSAAVRGGA